MRVTFIFLLCIFSSSVFNIFFNLNVLPYPLSPSRSFARSEDQSLVKTLYIDGFTSLKILFLTLFSGIFVLLRLDQLKFNYRFISLSTCTSTFSRVPNRSNSLYKDFLLLFLKLTYIVVFDFYLIILLPTDFFQIHFLTERRIILASKCIRNFHCCNFNLFFCTLKRTASIFCIYFRCLYSYPHEMIAYIALNSKF